MYAVKNFPLFNDLIKHARAINIFNTSCSFESVLYLVNHIKSYVSFTNEEINNLEQVFILLHTVTLNDFSTAIKDEDGNSVTYRIDVLWFYLHEMKIIGTQHSKFHNLFRLARVVLSIVYSNAEEESLFSRVRNNLTAQRASLSLNATLSSILTFQRNRRHGENCFNYNPSIAVLERSKKVTKEYNKEHPRKWGKLP